MKNIFTILVLVLAFTTNLFALKEITQNAPTGAAAGTYYAVIANASLQAWKVTAAEFDATTTTGEWGDYDDITLTEDTVFLGKYYATFPSTIPQGRYYVRVYQKLGASPAYTDTPIGEDFYAWNGSSESSVLDVDVAKIEGADATTTLGTAQSGDAYALIGNPAGDYLSEDIAAIASVVSTTATLALTTKNHIESATYGLSALNTDIDGIKTKTDGLNFTGTDVKATLDSETVALSATGLNNIPITEVDGLANTWPEMLVQVWQYDFYKKTSTNTHIKTYKANSSTVNTTQAVTSNSTTKTVGKAE